MAGAGLTSAFAWEKEDYMLNVKAMLADAVSHHSGGMITALKEQDTILHSRFRYFIAEKVSKYLLESFGSIIMDIRLYGSTMEYNAGKYSDIDLIIVAEKMGEEIKASLKELDRLITAEYYHMIGEEADQYSYILDGHIIDESYQEHDSSKSYLISIFNNDSVSLAAA